MHVSFENDSAVQKEVDREEPTEQSTYWMSKLGFGHFFMTNKS